MAIGNKDVPVLRKIGDLEPGSKYEHMGVYVCLYNTDTDKWTVCEKAKRKEAVALFGVDEELDGADIFDIT